MNGVTRRHIALPITQRGVVVLLMLLILAVSAASYFLVKRLNGNALNTERDKVTAAALMQAKAALIGYAASDSNRPGELPCPDVDNDGKITGGVDTYPGTNCANVNLIGRLPWYTLRLPDLRDGYGERLWYALANDFHATGNTPALNTSTIGRLFITGTSPANAVIAIVFSPGPALGNQSRDSANVNSVANYLEGDNANGDTTYETRYSSGTFNDKLLPITYNDLFSVVTRRVASEIGIQLTAYFSIHDALPDNLSRISAVQISTDPKRWLYKQQWTDSTITTYTPSSTSPTSATLKFSNCASLTYTIEIVNSKTTVSGHSC